MDKNSSQIEKCVVCGKITSAKKDDFVKYRMFYVEGCGQLCEDCYKKIYQNG